MRHWRPKSQGFANTWGVCRIGFSCRRCMLYFVPDHVILGVTLMCFCHHMTLYGIHRVPLCTEFLFINLGILEVFFLSEKTTFHVKMKT